MSGFSRLEALTSCARLVIRRMVPVMDAQHRVIRSDSGRTQKLDSVVPASTAKLVIISADIGH